jgi:hypothetical protein
MRCLPSDERYAIYALVLFVICSFSISLLIYGLVSSNTTILFAACSCILFSLILLCAYNCCSITKGVHKVNVSSYSSRALVILNNN